MKAAFTLIETLVVFTVIAVLIAIAVPATTRMSVYSARMKSVSNLRQIGVAAHLYANDHNQQLPGQPALTTASPSQWPSLFCEYLSPSDPRVFLDPMDRQTASLPLAQVLSDTVNNTGYVYNGFDDIAINDMPPAAVPLTRLVLPAETVLLAQKVQGAAPFYVDLVFQPLADLTSLLNPAAYEGGSHYLYVDGSVRFLQQMDYSNTCWLVDKSFALPLPTNVNGHEGSSYALTPPAGGPPL